MHEIGPIVLVFLPDKSETGAPEEGRLHADGDLVGVAALLLLLVAVLAAEEPVVVHGVPGVVIIIEINCQNGKYFLKWSANLEIITAWCKINFPLF